MASWLADPRVGRGVVAACRAVAELSQGLAVLSPINQKRIVGPEASITNGGADR